MKAIVLTSYGSPDVLQLTDIDKPEVGDDNVLVRVRAVSVNAYDWHHMRGKPYLFRTSNGVRKPTQTVLGVDLAGEVEAVGKNVTEFQPGDVVFGARSGALAEYVRGTVRNFIAKPPTSSFEQASAVPTAGVTALQALRDKGNLQPGQHVLINGAAGGVGTFAVQIAKSFGAKVTAVCSTHNLELVRSLGADHVIDYIHDDFTKHDQKYDLILDVAASRPLSALRRVLSPTGTLVIIGASKGNWIGPALPIIKAVAISRFSSQTLHPFLAQHTKPDLTALRDLLASGTITPVIDRTYPFPQTPAAIRYLETTHARGKVIITL